MTEFTVYAPGVLACGGYLINQMIKRDRHDLPDSVGDELWTLRNGREAAVSPENTEYDGSYNADGGHNDEDHQIPLRGCVNVFAGSLVSLWCYGG